MVNTEPAKIRAVYESKTYALELLFMHALKKGVISNRSGVFTFGEILLGVEDKAVVSYFANPNNIATTRAIEAVTYGVKKLANPLENEARAAAEDEDFQLVNIDEDNLDDSLKVTSLDGPTVHTENTSDLGLSDSSSTLTPQQKAAITRAANLQAIKK
jgi:hypothetical protein